ncbi:alpha-1,2-fucosyltransferase [Bacteroides fragilis]|uniref:alpha-1,2-fucosyltransferase n=1 Tax=Bacteroides hominis TaxID=2763023 RepID=UPI002940EDF1|nr:alpha-1,2-fucosyltransferase [Bacteroides fragilis]
MGNQIMTYALWYYLKKRSNPILYLRKNDLNSIFSFTQSGVRKRRIADLYIKLYKRVRKFLCVKPQQYVLPQKMFLFPFIVIDYPEWNDYKFIAEVQNEIRDLFSFPTLDGDIKNSDIVKQMKRCNSVSIHVRRGDYQNNVHWRIILGDICDENYYRNAMNKVAQIIEKPVYFVFSDDIVWVKNKLQIPNAIFIDWNVGDKYYRDMQLMSYCKVNILANSTFSLSATWLNSNSNPIRIVPSKWLNLYDDDLASRYIPSSWIMIDNKRPMVSIIIKEMMMAENFNDIIKQTFDDFEIVYFNNNYDDIDPRMSSSNPIGKYCYYYNKDVDSKLFRSNDHLRNWLILILQELISKCDNFEV